MLLCLKPLNCITKVDFLSNRQFTNRKFFMFDFFLKCECTYHDHRWGVIDLELSPTCCDQDLADLSPCCCRAGVGVDGTGHSGWFHGGCHGDRHGDRHGGHHCVHVHGNNLDDHHGDRQHDDHWCGPHGGCLGGCHGDHNADHGASHSCGHSDDYYGGCLACGICGQCDGYCGHCDGYCGGLHDGLDRAGLHGDRYHDEYRDGHPDGRHGGYRHGYLRDGHHDDLCEGHYGDLYGICATAPPEH